MQRTSWKQEAPRLDRGAGSRRRVRGRTLPRIPGVPAPRRRADRRHGGRHHAAGLGPRGGDQPSVQAVVARGVGERQPAGEVQRPQPDGQGRRSREESGDGGDAGDRERAADPRHASVDAEPPAERSRVTPRGPDRPADRAPVRPRTRRRRGGGPSRECRRETDKRIPAARPGAVSQISTPKVS